jgi:hypothetical protein
MASCCCWPPDRLPPRRAFISCSTGKNSYSSSGMSSFGERSPVRMLSCTVNLGKIMRPCGT